MLKLYKLRLILILLIAVPLTGCVSMAVSLAEKFMPTYSEVENSWGALPSGEGRVVIYYPALSFLEGNNLRVVVAGERYDLLDNSFFFLDLPAGDYSLKYYKKDGAVDFTLAENDIIYIKANESGGLKWKSTVHPPEIIPESQARRELLENNYRHFLMDPIPANKNI